MVMQLALGEMGSLQYADSMIMNIPLKRLLKYLPISRVNSTSLKRSRTVSLTIQQILLKRCIRSAETLGLLKAQQRKVTSIKKMMVLCWICVMQRNFGILNNVTNDGSLTSLLHEKLCRSFIQLGCLSRGSQRKVKSSMQHKAMGKVLALSNTTHWSTKMSDTMHKVTGTTFINPTPIRWSLDFESVKCVLDIGNDKVRQYSSEMKLKGDPIPAADMRFLEVRAKVMVPVAAVLK